MKKQEEKFFFHYQKQKKKHTLDNECSKLIKKNLFSFFIITQNIFFCCSVSCMKLESCCLVGGTDFHSFVWLFVHV